jgi:hypothetical protein
MTSNLRLPLTHYDAGAGDGTGALTKYAYRQSCLCVDKASGTIWAYSRLCGVTTPTSNLHDENHIIVFSLSDMSLVISL